jgi:filamentous hemagglutinin family protein
MKKLESTRNISAVAAIVAVPVAILAWLAQPAPASAQIATDGTVGPAQALPGSDVAIPDSLGTRLGGNLFHSFEQFNVQAGGSATFIGAPDIAHVISRVTGGSVSAIDGALISEIGTDGFWFINPAGVMFGPEAEINVPAAFHVSTADELRLADGSTFSATDPDASSLTVAPPEAFGFLGPSPAPIAVNGATLAVDPGATLSLTGGDIAITGGTITAGTEADPDGPGGRIKLVAMAGPGSVAVPEATPAEAAQGAIRLSQGSLVEASGDGGGTIHIRSGELLVEQSRLIARNTGLSDSLGMIDAVSGTARLTQGFIGTRAANDGAAGPVNVTVRNLTLEDGGQIFSISSSTGDTGNVSVRADTISMFGNDIGVPTLIATQTEAGSSGNAGTVQVDTGQISVQGGAQILSISFARGDAGPVFVEADALSISDENAQIPTLISSQIGSDSIGNAGNVEVNANRITMRGGAITSDIFGQGNAGTVLIKGEKIEIDGAGQAFDTGLFAVVRPAGSGSSGNLVVEAEHLLLRSGFINSDSFGDGPSGNVDIRVGSLTALDGGQISASSQSLESIKGGYIRITATENIVLAGLNEDHPRQLRSGIFNDALGNADAGDIAITTPLLVIDAGRITTDTTGSADAGSVTVNADRLEIRNEGQIFVGTDGAGASGDAYITSKHIQIDGSEGVESAGVFSTVKENGLGSGGSIIIDADEILIRSSFIDADSFGIGPSGNIDIRVVTLTALDGGQIGATSRSLGSVKGGDVWITATDGVILAGLNENHPRQLRSGIFNDALGNADAGDILITAPSLRIDGGRITTDTTGSADAGSVIVTTDHLEVRNEGQIFVGTDGAGQGGDLIIDAGSVEIIGISDATLATPDTDGPITGLFSNVKLSGSGSGGNVAIRAGNVRLSQGAAISTQTLGSGRAGTITIEVNEALQVDDSVIETAVAAFDEPSLPATVATAGGDLTIAADDVRLTSGGTITARTDRGPGSAGNIRLSAGGTLIGQDAAITTEAVAGAGGQITIQVGELIDLQDSAITSSVINSGAEGNGGNINIDPRFLILDNSVIQANARNGDGGNISIQAGNLFFQPGDRTGSLEEAITASSELGIDGTIAIDAPDTDVSGGLVELPAEFLNAAALLPTACAARVGTAVSSLVNAGRDGLPADPARPLTAGYRWPGTAAAPPLGSGDPAVPFTGLQFGCAR